VAITEYVPAGTLDGILKVTELRLPTASAYGAITEIPPMLIATAPFGVKPDPDAVTVEPTPPCVGFNVSVPVVVGGVAVGDTLAVGAGVPPPAWMMVNFVSVEEPVLASVALIV